MEDALIVALSTCPEADARRLASELVRLRLAACVNIVPSVQSIYRWKEQIESDEESLMIIKTADSRWEALAQWLKSNHPYDVPELLALPVTSGLPAYLQWAIGELTANPS